MGQNLDAVVPFPDRLSLTLERRTNETGHAIEGLSSDLVIFELAVHSPGVQPRANDKLAASDLGFDEG